MIRLIQTCILARFQAIVKFVKYFNPTLMFAIYFFQPIVPEFIVYAQDPKSSQRTKLKYFLINNQAIFGRNIQKCHEQTVFLVVCIVT
jgi:hypothetical protein